MLAPTLACAALTALQTGEPTFPGTDEGLTLLTALGGASPGDLDVQTAQASDTLTVELASDNPALNGAVWLLGVNFLPSEFAPIPSAPGLAIDLAQPFESLVLGLVTDATPLSASFDLIPELAGSSLLLQGLAIPVTNPAAAANSLFASTDARRIDVLPASGPLVLTETLRLVGDDTTVGDNFGFDVAIDSDLVAIGAPFDNIVNPDAGSAYTFDAVTGEQTAKFTTPFLGSFGDNFGTSVDLRGNNLVVGAPREDAVTTLSGIIYGFNGISGQAGPQLTPVATGGGTPVGHSLGEDIDWSDQLLVSGSRGDTALTSGGGSVHVFDAASLALLGKLFPEDPGFADNFGSSVGASGSLVVVGSPFDDDSADDAGSAYLFDGGSGQQLFKWAPADLGANDLFGEFVAIDGDRALIGAPFLNGPDFENSGAVYVYDTGTGELVERLTSPDPGFNFRFGDGLAIAGPYVLIGESLGRNSQGVLSGVVHVYDRETLAPVFQLEPSDGLLEDAFGESIAIDGQRVVVGARGSDALGNLAGAAYLFTLPTS